MHALGFNHEQQRGDQAQNVQIHYGWFQIFFPAKISLGEQTLETGSKKILTQDFILLSRLCQITNGCPLVMDMIALPVGTFTLPAEMK